jgi:hypothetical protein
MQLGDEAIPFISSCGCHVVGWTRTQFSAYFHARNGGKVWDIVYVARLLCVASYNDVIKLSEAVEVS